MDYSTAYVLRIWRGIRRPMILAILLYGCFMLLPGCRFGDCANSRSTVISKQGTHLAITEEECCDGGCIVTIKLSGVGVFSSSTDVFVYIQTNIFEPKGKPWTHDPVVVWVSEKELEITVDRVGHVEKQSTESHGVKISYRIGIVDDQGSRQDH